MPYTPINTLVYLAAYTGALGGMSVGGGWITNSDPANYSRIVVVVGAYAEAVDHAWNDATAISTIEYDKIQCVTEQLFVGRGAQPDIDPTYQLRTNWDTVAAAVVALVREADIYLNSQGIVPPSSDGGVKRARGAVIEPLPADLTQFDVAQSSANDGIGYQLGDIILAVGETQNKPRSGPWVIAHVDAGKGTLVRPSWWAHGATLETSAIPIELGSEGVLFGNTRFRAMGKQTGSTVTHPTNTFIVDTDDPGMYPEVMCTTVRLVDGSSGPITLPILSSTTGFAVIDRAPHASTTAYYDVNITPGDYGSGANVVINALTAAGEVDRDAGGSVQLTMTNQSLPLPA